ncbi:hypothetical protein AB0O58_19805 [Rhodococcus sp. NPDC080181]|uniref:hypothetical protein n=1 Tax=Rhodococcus sp. NPDC080181 TaxID=3155292 RepID=UPI00344DA0EE
MNRSQGSDAPEQRLEARHFLTGAVIGTIDGKIGHQRQRFGLAEIPLKAVRDCYGTRERTPLLRKRVRIASGGCLPAEASRFVAESRKCGHFGGDSPMGMVEHVCEPSPSTGRAFESVGWVEVAEAEVDDEIAE